jgi:hypothetical protein
VIVDFRLPIADFESSVLISLSIANRQSEIGNLSTNFIISISLRP